MDIRAFITHKKAETFSDCQDRFSINSDTKSVAVSDGMSQSFFKRFGRKILLKLLLIILSGTCAANSVRRF